MAEFVNLNTRISLKYDHYNNWKTNNPVLNAGEVALVYIPTDTTLTEADFSVLGTTPPQVMMKVGDGTHAYNELKYINAMAADVSAWAKATSKPEYQANEIIGLTNYINGQIQDTDTQYNLVKVSDVQYKIMSKAKGDSEFTTEVGVIDIPQYDDSALTERVAAAEAALTTLEGRVAAAEKAITDNKAAHEAAIAEVDGKVDAEATRAAAKEAEIESALNTYKTTNDARVLAVEEEVDTLQTQIQGLTGAMHFAGVVDAVPADGAEGYASGDVVVVSSTHKEYVYDGAVWHELGDEGSHITKTEVSTTYETKADSTAKKTELEGKITAEETRAKDVEEAQAARIAALETNSETKTDAAAKLTEAKEYADGLNTAMDTRVAAVEAKPAMGITADDIAEYDEAVTKAGSAIQDVTGSNGIKATKTGTTVNVAIDDTVTYVFNCGTSQL